MTNEKLLEIVERYIQMLDHMEYNDSRLDHVHDMLRRIPSMINEGRKDGLMRRLGFIQGVLWCTGIFQIDEMKAHNQEDAQ